MNLISVLIAVIFAAIYAFTYPYMVCLVRRIDEEERLEQEEEEKAWAKKLAEKGIKEGTAEAAALEEEDEEYSFWYSFVFGDMLFDFIFFRFVKYVIELVKRKEKVDFDVKKQLALALWGFLISLGVLGYFGVGLYSILSCLFVMLLTMITVIDILRMEIPCELNGFIYVLGLLSIFLFPSLPFTSRLIGALIISVPMQLIVFLVPGGFGGGDIKLMFVAGLFLGTSATIAAFFIGLVLGGLYGILQLALRKLGRKEHFAFGPFLSIGLIVSLFCGNQLVQLYLSTMMGR